MKVRYTVKYKDLKPFTETMEREIFAAWVDLKYKFDEIEWIIVDVCLTRWFYDSETGWYRTSRIGYVPDKPEEWQLNINEMAKRMKYSPSGFTQR